MIPAFFTVGEAVSHEAQDMKVVKAGDKFHVDCKIRGIPFRGEETRGEHEKYAFVLRNKTSGKIKIVKRQPLYFRPFKEDKEISTTKKPLSRAALVEAFGSGKSLRIMQERQEKEALSGSARGAATVVSAVTKVAQSRATPQKSAKDRDGDAMLPRFLNVQALDPAEVYDLDALLPGAVQVALKEEADELAASTMAQRQTWQQEGKYCELVLSRLRFLPGDPESRSVMAVQLCYLNYLYRLTKITAAMLRSSSALEDFPKPVSQFLLRSFTMLADTANRKVRCCPNWMKDKQTYHLLLLVLVIDNYKTELSGLMTHLSMSNARLVKFFQALGCKIQTDKANSEKYAALKTPVTFPEPRGFQRHSL